jgi:uncharacterized protein
MQPFYFGSSRRPVFGVYHAPEADRAKRAGVVLCHPLGHEYLRAHRAFRNLAVALAAQGLHVLRFDYSGSGDSAGDDEDVTIEQCLADLDAAIEELKDTSGIAKVSLVGLRLGATFAAMAACRRSDVERLVLWDPVLDGASYLEEMLTLQRGWLRDRLGAEAERLAEDGELIGFAATKTMCTQLNAATLLSLPAVKAKGVSLMISEERPSYAALVTTLAASKVPVACTAIPGSGDWTNVDDVHQILLPHAMVRAIVAVMTS